MKKKGMERALFVYTAKEKKIYYHRAVLVCTAKGKKTNRVPRRPRQPAAHPAALRCDGLCRREQHIYTALPRQGAVGAYNHHCTGAEVEWRPPLL